ncbi:MAG: prepilin-type N-terminal cleavage/methylation domain-containing protein [Oleiphilaceae bacterium]|jgi:prepilin-type N-terminal cleavage/methylation domain-containing protein
MNNSCAVKCINVLNKTAFIQKMKAFTLVELMFVLAIMSILISLAFPSYKFITQKNQRTEGQILLLDIQSQLERYYFHHQNYPDSLSKLRNYQLDEIDSEHLYYKVTLEVEDACPSRFCYLLIAKHSSGQEKETLSLYSSGEKQGPW